jgi:tetratricopeptide (TPR) repeat protein
MKQFCQACGRVAQPAALLYGLALTLLVGCKTPPLYQARTDFYAGQPESAEQLLLEIPAENKDEVLFLMERGMIRHVLREYDASSDDWRRAADRGDCLETYSLTHGATSLVSNDRALPFRGAPFEMTLLYSFLAKNYIAQQNWDYAAICARNIIKRLEDLNGFPDIAYSRYIAGLCLALINDTGNAAIQFRAANELLEDFQLDPETGRILASTNTPPAAYKGQELVVFIGMGRMPPGYDSYEDDDEAPPVAEIFAGNRRLGEARIFNNTASLLTDTKARMAALQLAKDAARIAAKEMIASSVETNNEALGDLIRIILFAMEMPDERRWETLPRWLAIARVPCPSDIQSYTVVFNNGAASKTSSQPLIRRGNILISFCRDLHFSESE